jgi:hypothetical protein
VSLAILLLWRGSPIPFDFVFGSHQLTHNNAKYSADQAAKDQAANDQEAYESTSQKPYFASCSKTDQDAKDQAGHDQEEPYFQIISYSKPNLSIVSYSQTTDECIYKECANHNHNGSRPSSRGGGGGGECRLSI